MKRSMTMAVGLLALVAGCTDPDRAQRILSEQGYTDIRSTGYEPLACSEDDQFHTGFEATSAAGKRVQGVVCSGLLKGATVRTF